MDYLVDPTQQQAAASNLLSLLISLLQWPANNCFHDCSATYKTFVLILTGRAEEIQTAGNSVALATIETSTGSFIPLGPLRLKIAEFWAQLLKVAANSPTEDLSSDLSLLELDSADSVTDAICHSLFDLDITGWFIDLLIEFPWHNMFHNVALKFIHILVHWTVPPSSARPLILALFTTHRLVARLAEGHRQGSHKVGYLGHFVQIGDHVKHFVARLKPTDPMHDPIVEAVRSQGWQEYLEDCLLPAQKRANQGDADDSSMFGEWRVKKIRTQDSYLDDDDLDALQPYSLEDAFEFDQDIDFEDDDEVRFLCSLG